MALQYIDTVTPDVGLKLITKLNDNFSNTGHAANKLVGTASDEVPTNGDLPTFGTAATADTGTGSTNVPTNAILSGAITGTATFSSDTYTFSTTGTGFPTLAAGMYLSFKLPASSVNTTTTPDVDYNGATYTIKWIDGSVLVADDIDEQYNKQPILFYFDGTDMLIASDISGSNSDGEWTKRANGDLQMTVAGEENLAITTSSGLGGFLADSSVINFPKAATSGVLVTPQGNRTSGDTGLYGSTLSTYQLRFRTISSTTADMDTSVSVSARWY